MVGGVISDIYHAHDRNTPMALFSAAALFGTGLAPLISGVIVSRTSWRWLFYSHAIVSAVFVLMIFFFFKETRGSVLLSRKAQKLNQYYEQLEKAGHHGVILSTEESPDEKCIQRIRWKVKSDEERASLLSMIKISVYRPFRKSIRFLTKDTTNNLRYALHRASGLLLLVVGIIQLGSPLPTVRFYTAHLSYQPQLQHGTDGRRFHFDVRRCDLDQYHQYLPRTRRRAFRLQVCRCRGSAVLRLC